MWSTNSTTGIYLEKMKTLIHKDIHAPVSTAAPLTIAKVRKQPKCPSADRWIKRMWNTHAIEYILSYTKNAISPLLQQGWPGEYHMLSKIEDKYCTTTDMRNPKSNTNHCICKTEHTDTGNKPTVPKGKKEVKVRASQACPPLVTPGTTQSTQLPRPECWSGEPFPSPGHLPHPGIEPRSPAVQVESGRRK